MPNHKSSKIVTTACILAMGFALGPAQAFAVSPELQAQLDEAGNKLSTLYSSAEQAGYELDTVAGDLRQTESDIDRIEDEIVEQKKELKDIQAQLGKMTSTQYKTGGTSLLKLLLNADDFSTMIESVQYSNKVAEQKRNAVDRSRELQESLKSNKDELGKKRDAQEKLVADKKKAADAANAEAAKAQKYYDQLSDEVKQELAREEEAKRQAAAEAARQAAEEAKKRAEQEAAAQAQQQQSQQAPQQSAPSPQPEKPKPQGGSSGGNVSSTPTASASSMVARAYGIIGSGYRWSGYVWTGSVATSAFTCSGVVDYALGLPTNSNSPASLMAKVQARGAYTTSESKLKYGDLVFYNRGGRIGHVGIYVGSGQVIDSIPNGGVQQRSLHFVDGFVGGGSII